MSIGVIGLGVVGRAVYKAFKDNTQLDVCGYDKVGEFSSQECFANTMKAEVVFVCVPTPTINGSQDLTALKEVITELRLINYKGVVCIKCTVLPGTCQELQELSGLNIVHNPEFLTAAKPYKDFMNQKSILLSGKQDDVTRLVGVYVALFGHKIEFLASEDYRTTELAKYYSNCFLAAKVTFANEMYDICEKLGADYEAVRQMAVSQGLIGVNHTRVPGPDGKFGYGLGCLPKETLALQAFCKELNLKQEVLNAAIEGNTRRRTFDSHCREVIDGCVKEIVI